MNDRVSERFKVSGKVQFDDFLDKRELSCLRLECSRILRIKRTENEDFGECDDDHCDEYGWVVRRHGCVLSTFGSCRCAHERGHFRWNHRGCCAAASRSFSSLAANDDDRSERRSVKTNESVFESEVTEIAIRGKIARMAAFLLRGCDEEDDERDEDEKNERVYLFNDQYVVKPAHEEGARFEWHRDGQYEKWTPDDTKEDDDDEEEGRLKKKKTSLRYLSAWVALDDVSEENGALRFKKDERKRFAEDFDAMLVHDEENDTIATMNAGSCVFFKSDVLHASGKNVSNEVRRAWMPQYSLGVPKERKGERINSNSDSFRCLVTPLRQI